MNTPITHLHPDSIRRDGQTQLRLQLNQEALKRYETLVINNGFEWPFNDKILVFYDGQNHWLADGFHRDVSWSKAFELQEQPVPPYPVDIRKGTLRDAIHYNIHHGNRHGIPFTREDRREIALKLIQDREWKAYSNREIARIAQMDEKTVRNLRKELEAPVVEFAADAPATEPIPGAAAATEVKAKEPKIKVDTIDPSVALATPPLMIAGAENPQLALDLALEEDATLLRLPKRVDDDGCPLTIVKLATPLACVSEDEQIETGLCEKPAFLAYAWMEYSVERGSFLWLVKPVCRVCAEREMEEYLAEQG